MAWIPDLETPQDRQNEVDVLEHLCGGRNLSYEQTVVGCRYDADIYKDGELYAIAEIKCRKDIPHDKYPDFIFKVDKWNACKDIAREKRVKFIILMRYTDGLFVIDETHQSLVGRKQWDCVMKNSKDGRMERVFVVPVSKLNRVEKKEN